MNQTIHFNTTMFDVTTEKENPINPIYGVSLLVWLRSELKGQLELSEPAAEDWGWYCELTYDGTRYFLGASACFEEGDDPTQALEWVLQVDKVRSLKEKIFGKNKITPSDRCFLFFKQFFEQNPAFTDVQSE
ncbi:hypothetical protein [Gallaecimonas sp. GXIMD1310]|uniref:hypothetical protein n=1 Tax=Gallaecimonas sp. GXIMD1310 TaxID=3131926 RepID=UPI00325347BE